MIVSHPLARHAKPARIAYGSLSPLRLICVGDWLKRAGGGFQHDGAGTDRSTKPDHGTADEEARHEAADAAAHLSASAQLIGTGNPALAAFFTAFTRHASPEDLIHFTGAELAALVKQAFERSAKRSRANR